jgi:UDP-N-acetylmuramate--alanine ligase
MDITTIDRVYFVGIGGIGMSALARFFKARGAVVVGYDRTETALTKQLAAEGMSIHYVDDVHQLDKSTQLVVYTPAIPQDHQELNWYKAQGYPVFKRSDVLQWITESLYSVTVAGTHGKTTISTLIGYLVRETGLGCNAFLGGIATNYNSNYWSSDNNLAVIEADEYDRSFLKLHPDVAVLTAMDADHLDIYGTVEQMEEAFIQYTKNIKAGGTLIVKHGLARIAELMASTTITYSLTDANATVHAEHVKEQNGGYLFNVVGPDWRIDNVELPIGGLHNVENTVAALTVCRKLGIDVAIAKVKLLGFKGVHRRFEYVVKTEAAVLIDDYAHHPQELEALIRSAKAMFPGRHCVVCFQPHLFTRTRDFADGFAQSLDLADEVLLLDIYPARELPLAGVTSAMIAQLMTNPNHRIVTKDEVLIFVAERKPELFVTAGAGDIDKVVPSIKKLMTQQ